MSFLSSLALPPLLGVTVINESGCTMTVKFEDRIVEVSTATVFTEREDARKELLRKLNAQLVTQQASVEHTLSLITKVTAL